MDNHIAKRQVAEWQLEDRCNEIQTDKNHMHKALWEGKTDNIVSKNLIEERKKEIKADREKEVEARRKRLAQLYKEEEQGY